jgi:nucleoside 2-deoxyribosyltransferase
MSSSVTVVGGCYVEDCSFPRSTIYRGSGMRAASILTGFGSNVTLCTVTGPGLADDFTDIAKRKGIKLESTSGSADIWFRYRHPLAKPDVYPAVVSAATYPDDVAADRALVFGMLEGRPKVLAKRAVYDPQDGFHARPFDENGSTAEELLIIASLSEGRALTAQEEPEKIARALLATGKCVGLIIKCGPQGALIATATAQQWIRPFPSKRVWKIGSGDVFSAAFAHAWLQEGIAILDSAWFASRVVAEYVGTRAETFAPECLKRIREEASAAATNTTTAARSIPNAGIYLAGPFFTTNQQWLVDEARSALREMGFKVFSPIHEIGEGPPEIVAPADIFALENSRLVFALLNGLDAGTLFEVGYARALGIPVVALAEAVDERSLTMLLGSGCAVLDDFATSIYTACWQLMGDV